MLLQYQPCCQPRHFVERFGLECQPEASMVRPGEQGFFVRRPRGDRAGSEAAARFEGAAGRWGLIPLFSKDGDTQGTFEARGETAASERNFHQPWKRGHRCVILTEALFRTGEAEDSVVRVSRADGQPLVLAGLWNGWRSPTGECVESFAVFTLPAQDHPSQRRAVFLRDAWVDDWLHCPVEETAAYLRPFAVDKLIRQPMPPKPQPIEPQPIEQASLVRSL